MESEQNQSTFAVQVMTWFEVNKKRLVIAGVALAGAWLIFYTYSHFQAQKELEADEALSAVYKSPLANPTKAQPDSASLLKVAETHASLPAGQRALLLAAGALFREGKYAEARAKFEKFKNDFPTSKLVAIAAYGIAACDDAANDLDKALAGYKSVETSYPSDPVVAQAKLAIAVIHEAKNNPAEALRVYEQLARSDSRSLWSSEAFSRREMLVAKFPQLLITNTPAPVTGIATNLPVVVRTNAAAVPAPAPTPVVIAGTNTAGAVAVSNAISAAINAAKTNASAVPAVPAAPAPKKP